MFGTASLLGRTHRRGRRRVVAVAIGLVVGLSAVVAVPSSGDEIADTRSEAERIADQIETLQHEAEVLTERYLDAQLAREELDQRIADTTARARRSHRRLVDIRARMRAAAVESYMSGSADSQMSALAQATEANDIGRRQGYADAASRDTDDLIDDYRGIEAEADGDARDLAGLRAAARRAERDIADAHDAADATLSELRRLEREVTGRLRRLVEAEQRRRAEERERAAELAAARAPAPVPALLDARTEDDEEADTPAPPPPATESPSGDDATSPPPEPAPPPAPPPPTGPSTGAAAAIAAAHSVLGVPYRWAGADPSTGFDCSGLTMWAWVRGGKSLPHSSRAQYAMSRKIPVSELQPGDLVFYNSPVSHVGLYIGDGMMIHAPHTGDVVKVSSIYYWSALTGGGRI